MGQLLLKALDWSEVWALIIPLSVLLFKRQQYPSSLKPVIVYLWLGFLINLVIDVIMGINVYFRKDLFSNNPFYNIHSVIRFACFSIYFIRLQPNSFPKTKRALTIFSLLFLVINFLFFEKFFNYDSFSGNLLATEAYLLLVYCMLYYLTELKNDKDNLFDSPHFWIVTGLCIYVVVNFFVFLFYLPMLYVDQDLAINIWNVHNIAFIIFCVFITKAIYGTFRYKPAI
jgi:hypothetical protein